MAIHESRFRNAPLVGSVNIDESVSVDTILARNGHRYTVEDDTAQFWVLLFDTLPELLGRTPDGSVSPRELHAHRRLVRNATFTMEMPQMDGASFGTELPDGNYRVQAQTTVLTDTVRMRRNAGPLNQRIKAGTFINLGTAHTKVYMVLEDATVGTATDVKVYPSVRATIPANTSIITTAMATVRYNPEAPRRMVIDRNRIGFRAALEEAT